MAVNITFKIHSDKMFNNFVSHFFRFFFFVFFVAFFSSGLTTAVTWKFLSISGHGRLMAIGD